MNKYPVSKNNVKCIGPCQKPGTYILHPTELIYVTNKVTPFCPIKKKIYYDNGQEVTQIIDECLNVSKEAIDQSDANISITFTYESFLKIYYNIYTIDDAFEWLRKNNYKSYFTKKRIINCSLKVFHDEKEQIDPRMIDTFIDIIKKRWINEILRLTNNLITITNSAIEFKKNDEIYDKDNKKNIIKINFIIEKMINNNYMTKFFSYFLNKYQEQWYEIEDLVDVIKDELLYYIDNSINKTL